MSPLHRDTPLTDRLMVRVARMPYRTATEHARALDADPASVSSILTKLTTGRVVLRFPDQGPKRGYTYIVAPATKVVTAL